MKSLIWAVAALFTLSLNVSAAEPELGTFLASPALAVLNIYQRFISPAKGTSCPMDPSDSSYSRQAVHRFGLIRGALMTADRLHRCGHDLERYDLVETPRGLKYADPLPQ